MKRIWLIRHGDHDWIGKALVGRKPGVSLNARGEAQAGRIAAELAGIRLAAAYSSPQRRAFETACPLANAQGLRVITEDALDEVNFGEWTGLSFDELARDARWHEWNSHRATARSPGGEAMREVQLRILNAVQHLGGEEPVAFVSHCDVIRAALVASLGLSLNEITTVDFEPGAMAYLEADGDGPGRVTFHAPLARSHP